MRKFLLLIFLCVPALAFSQWFRLSEQTQVSLLTFGPSQDAIFNAFGHSAIRIMDPNLGIDYFYNYGVFTFDDNFYLNFARGHNRYKLGVYSYPDNRDYYIAENRFIHEQILNLTTEQKEKIFRYLQWNARPENQYYNYDYFYDNCSTRIRDVFATVLKDEINFDGSFITSHYSIRQLEDLYCDYQPWSGLGINVGLGSPIDKEATPYQYMYLPDYLESFFDHATIKAAGTAVPLVKEKIIVFKSRPVQIKGSLFTPWMVFGFVLLISIVVSYLDWKRKKLSAWIDFIFLLISGVLGVVLLLLWLATDHHACVRNFNVLWALPTNLVVGFLILRKKKAAWLTSYFRIATLLTLVILMAWRILPQQLSVFLIPLVIALGVRYLTNWVILKRSAMN